MTSIPALVEGHLDGQVLRVLWGCLRRREELQIRDARGSSFWKHARRYNQAGRYQTVIGLADLEGRPCFAAAVAELGGLSSGFVLRLAVRMVESWLLADRASFAQFIGVGIGALPTDPDQLDHPKRFIHELAARSRKRAIREGLSTAGSGATVGPQYTSLMSEFVRGEWDPVGACSLSPSLRRACLRLANI